jgi:hypothetical protein
MSRQRTVCEMLTARSSSTSSLVLVGGGPLIDSRRLEEHGAERAAAKSAALR